MNRRQRRLIAGCVVILLLAAWIIYQQTPLVFDKPLPVNEDDRPLCGSVPEEKPERTAVDPVILMIAGLTEVKDYRARREAISSLGDDLPEAAVTTLLTYLRDPSQARPGNLWDLSNKNDVLQRLIAQQTLHPGVGTLLVEVASDPSQDPIWRDYALQFVAPYAERKFGDLQMPLDWEVDRLTKALTDAIASGSGEIPGTALIGLNRMSSHAILGARVPKEMVIAQADAILARPHPAEMERITAIQIMGQSGNEAFKNQAASIATDTSATVMERMAAIATLGQVGTMDELLTVKGQMEESGALDPRLQRALKGAVARLNKIMKRTDDV